MLPGGVTAHKLFNAPIPMYPDSPSRVGAETAEAEIFRAAKIIVWDEASMIPKDLLSYADRVLRDVTGKKDKAFGNKIVLLGGDWRQVLPIVPGGDRAAAVAATIRYQASWASGAFQQFELTQNMRSANASSGPRSMAHREWLQRVGDGLLPTRDDLAANIVELPRDLCLDRDATSDDLLEWVFRDFDTYRRLAEQPAVTVEEREAMDEYFCGRAVLTPLNETVDRLNQIMLDRLGGQETVARSRDSTVEDDVDANTYPTELLNTLNPPGCAPHELRLKKGAVVLITHNIDRERGICNGTRAIVTHAAARVLVVRVLTGRAKGQTVELPRTRQNMEGSKTKMPFKMRRVQFPVKLAWAITINKSQGQTLVRGGVYLPDSVFSHGQLYVACSRVGDPDNLRLMVSRRDDNARWHGWLIDPVDGKEKCFTSNVVSYAALGATAPTPRAPPGGLDTSTAATGTNADRTPKLRRATGPRVAERAGALPPPKKLLRVSAALRGTFGGREEGREIMFKRGWHVRGKGVEQ